MNTKSVTPLLIFAFTILGAAQAWPQSDYDLQYKYREGKTYRYADHIATTSTQEMMGKEMKGSGDVTMTLRMVVDRVADDGGLSFVTSWDSIRIVARSQVMDTTIVPVDAIGKRSRLVITKYGVVTGREIIDSVKNQAALMGIGRRELVRFHQFSGKPVKTGGQWTITSNDSLEMMGGMSRVATDITYTLAGTERKLGHDCVRIPYTGKASMTGKGSMAGMELYLEGTTQMKGTVFIDVENGLLVSDEMTATNESTVAATGPQAMTIPMSQTITTTRSLLEE